VIFGTTSETIPHTVPYLCPPRKRLEVWQQLLAPCATLKVGIVWAGRKKPDPLRSCRLADLAPLAGIQGITFFSLQMDETAIETASPPRGMPMIDLTEHIGDFADTAAFITHLDLVITIDTSVAHLSGALGKPTFVLLPHVSDWRWMLKRSDSPWYPTMRLFRQTSRGSWVEPVSEVAIAIGGMFSDSARSASLHAKDLPPSVVERYQNAVGLLDAQRYDESQALLLKIIEEGYNWSLPIVLLGLNHYHKGDLRYAERCFRRAIDLDAECLAACRCLGLLLNELERFEEAASVLSSALSIAPDDCDLLRYLADALYGLGKMGEACEWYSKTLARRPDDFEILINFGAANEVLNRFDEAEQSLLRAIELYPRDYRPYLNLGGVFLSQNHLDRAERCFRKALEYHPNDATTRWNLAQVSLIKGDYRRGFHEFETRFAKKNPVRVNLRGLPLWDGSPLAGRTLLVFTEQAFGDTIQFCRFLPLLAERGGHIMLFNNLKPLDSMLETLPYVEQIFRLGQKLPACDWAVPMLSIPHLMDITLESLPSSTPYLFPNEERCSWWREYVREDRNLKVGIAWKGRIMPDPRRSAPPDCFAVLKNLPGVSWYSLQVAEGSGVMAELPDGFCLNDPTTLLHDFSETAALMSQLDLIISIDSAVAHLAGALGRPAWVLLPYSPDWRWMLERVDSPWYPTMRLFRQPRPGEWEAVFSEVASALKALLMAHER
jgi:tetratricopeptide (TPR) repeat protein